jgi:hypothetical protein
MKINIDIHILKKIIQLQRKKDEAVVKANKAWTIMRDCDAEIKALTEFIEGECEGNKNEN